MAISIRGKNIEITDALRERVEKRVSKITKYFASSGEVTALLTVQKDRHIAEITVPVNGIILRAEESTNDMYASIDMVIKKIEKQIEKYRTKLSKRLTSGFKADLMPSSKTNDLNDENEFEIVKSKRFAIKPMPIEEAILQMNLLNHDFYVFANAETEEVNVIYRRKDSKYGLIGPEI